MFRVLLFAMCFFLMAISSVLYGQDKHEKLGKKGSFYFYFGYNKSFFSDSNLHFTAPDYDFTVYSVEAKDRPSAFGWDYINPTKFTIPQNNYRLGYFFTDRFAISFGMDHMKYVITENQQSIVSGVISTEASTKYAGSYLNEEITLSKDFLEFEHTDGFNLVSLDIEYLYPIVTWFDQRFKLHSNFGLGGIWVATKTNVKVFGSGLDNDYHIAGYHLAAKAGPRLEYKNRFFFLCEMKTGYANLRSVLINNEAPEKANHNVGFIEFYFAIGWSFRI